MIRNGFLGYSLKNEDKAISSENKVIANSFKLFHTCKCGKETLLDNGMLTDSCEDNNGNSFTGWKYICTCGKINNIHEESFDSAIESFYDHDLVEE